MEYEIYCTGSELYHHGIKGMRWGVRRYQNKDGTLTKAGQRRYKKELEAIRKEEAVLKNRKATAAKLARLDARRKAIDDGKRDLDGDDDTKKPKTDEAQPAKKAVKDMTDEELAFAIRRVQMEKQYESLTAQPETVEKGNSFVKDFMAKSAVPAIQEAGKTIIRDSLLKAGKKYLGLNTENADDYVNKLGKEVKKMTLEKQYKKLKEEMDAEKAAADDKAKKNDSPDNSKAKTDDGDTGKSKSSKTDDKVHEGTVEGFGTSAKATNQARSWTSESKIFDAEYWEVSGSDNTSSGQAYVSDRLGLPAPGLPSARDDD